MPGQSSSSSRNKKRVLKVAARKRSDPSNLPPTPSRQVHERLAQLEEKVLQLGDAFDQNAEAYDYSFKMVEAMQHVFQRVLQEYLQNGEFHYKNCDLPDWHEYMKYYWVCQTFAEFAQWLGGLSKEKPEQGTLIVPPSIGDERVVETVIFGGG